MNLKAHLIYNYPVSFLWKIYELTAFWKVGSFSPLNVMKQTKVNNWSMFRARAIIWRCDSLACGLWRLSWDHLTFLPRWKDREHWAVLLDDCTGRLRCWAYFLGEWKLWHLHLTELFWGTTEMCMGSTRHILVIFLCYYLQTMDMLGAD